jgi:hypothetical protein
MIAQREMPLGPWLTKQTPTCCRTAPSRQGNRLRRHAGLMLELALLLILARLLPGARKGK